MSPRRQEHERSARVRRVDMWRLAAADGRFIGQLCLTYSLPTPPPRDPWDYGA